MDKPFSLHQQCVAVAIFPVHSQHLMCSVLTFSFKIAVHLIVVFVVVFVCLFWLRMLEIIQFPKLGSNLSLPGGRCARVLTTQDRKRSPCCSVYLHYTLD